MYMSCVFLTVRFLSLLEIAVATASIIGGCVTLDRAWPNREWPIASGVGIWAGAVVMASGICGLIASLLTPDPHNGHQKRLFVAHCTIANLSYVTSIQCIGYSAWILKYCSGNGNFADWCYPNEAENRKMAVVMIVMGALLIACAIPVSLSFCVVLSKFNTRVSDQSSFDAVDTSRHAPRTYQRSWRNN